MKMMLRIYRGGCLFLITVGCFFATELRSKGEAASAESEVVFGGVKVRVLARTVVFPARVNAVEGTIEYGIVTPAGPTHESLLVTEINPLNLHAAMLLLGIRGDASQAGVKSRGQINADSLRGIRDLRGESVSVRVVWRESNGVRAEGGLDAWMRYADGRRVAAGPWTYNGSFLMDGGRFAAETEGAVLCLVTNPAALLNNPREGRLDDLVWEVASSVIPPLGTPVEVELKLFSTDEVK